MATPPDHAPPRDARRHGDSIALLSALARQRGSEDALDTFWAVLRDMASAPAITHALRALQQMAAAGAFTHAERFYLVTELGDFLVSRRVAQQPRPHEALGTSRGDGAPRHDPRRRKPRTAACEAVAPGRTVAHPD
jgi:hypothetical protein